MKWRYSPCHTNAAASPIGLQEPTSNLHEDAYFQLASPAKCSELSDYTQQTVEGQSQGLVDTL